MARPRINKSSNNKGKGTSFGKKSEAEQSFLKKKKSSGRYDEFEEKNLFAKNPRSLGSDFSKPRVFKNNVRGNYKSERPFDKNPTFKNDSKPHGIKSEGNRYSKPDGQRPKKTSIDFKGGPKKFDKPFNQGENKRLFGRTNSPPSFGSKPDSFKKKSFDNRSNFDKPRITKEDFKRTSITPADDAANKPRQRDKSSFSRPFKKSFVQSRVNSDANYSKKRSAETKVEDGLTRLNKYIANSGVGSRRDADELIKMGLISVNGTVVTELGSKVKKGDVVRYEDKVLKAEKLVYILLNKPKGFITTTDDPQERNTVMGLVAGACKERIYPVGRLDRNTTGLLLLTNDGELADRLTHPSYKAKKVYKVELDKPLTKNDFIKIQEGVHLQEGKATVDDIAMLSDDSKTVGLEIHIGWNRIVRRLFEALGYEVVKLDRSVYAGLDKKDVGRGQWRFLKPEEVVRLKHFK
jgi:23S rRNA pseudouridine2605 synthase